MSFDSYVIKAYNLSSTGIEVLAMQKVSDTSSEVINLALFEVNASPVVVDDLSRECYLDFHVLLRLSIDSVLSLLVWLLLLRCRVEPHHK